MSETTAPVTPVTEKKARTRDALSTFKAFAAKGPVQQLKACVRHAMQDLNRRDEVAARARVGKTLDEAITRCLTGEPWAVCTYSSAENAAIAQGGTVTLAVVAEDESRQDEAVNAVIKRLTERGLDASSHEEYRVTARLPAPAAEAPVSAPVAQAG